MKLSRHLLATSGLAFALGATPALAGEIAGVVVDESDTIALQSANVRIVELDRQTVTGRDGAFRFGDVPAGSYTLQASYVGVPAETIALNVPATGSVKADFALGGDNAAQMLVVGQGANQASALSRKRASDVVSDVVTRDAIGQFPDQNVAESLRRLPGVNVLNDQGEGRFVSVRGLDPELISSSVNGVRLPSPEGDVRSVALDVISSDIIESIEVKKSLTPDMDADTIGASIDIETTRAFDRRRDLLTVKLEGSYNDYSGQVTPKGSVDFSTRVSDWLGISGGASYYQRKFETDNVEADGWDDDDGLIFPEEVNYRDYDVERERISANLNFDVRASDSTTLYARGIYSQFDDQEFRRETSFKFNESPSEGSGTSIGFSDEDGEIELQRSIKDRFETQKVRSVVVGGETILDGWRAEYSASWAKSSEYENGSIDPANFERSFEGDGVNIGWDFSDPRVPAYSVSGNTADFLDPAGYALDDITLTALSDSQDEEYAAKFDLAREFAMDGGTFTVQGGAKGRWRQKSYNLNAEYWENEDLTLADVLGAQTYRITDIWPVASHHGASDFFFANRDAFELNPVDTAFDSAVEDYAVDEDIMAGYLLGRWDGGPLTVIGGVRYEHTKNRITGNDVLLVEEGGQLPGGAGEAGEDTVIVAPTLVERDYGHWLPSLNIRWEAADDFVFRLAGYRSLVRPKLSKLAPRFIVEQNDDGEREGEFGNPDLKPFEAWNLDASAEYYLSSNGAITAAVFYKDVKNFIVDTYREDGTYRGIAFDEATVPINGESAEIYGFELGYSQAFTMLPAPFDGLLLQANYTYTDATGMVPTDGDPDDLRQINLPATAKHTGNIALGYDKGPISFRLSGTYRDKYLDELGDVAEEDRIVDNHFQLDLSAKYRLTDNVQIFYEWVNINNAKYYAYNTYGGRQNLLQYEEYNWTMKFGAKVNF